jgi:hypothetical protein
VEAVVDWLVEHEIGIVAVEAYGPVGASRGSLVAECEIERRRAGEPWRDYVARAAAETLDAVTARAGSGNADGLRFFLATATEDRHRDAGR